MTGRPILRLIAAVTLLSLLLAGCAKDTPVSDTNPSEITAAPSETTPTIPESLSVGDNMPLLTFTDPEGKTISLEALLREKKLVVLNFWFEDCGYCKAEFPVMEVAYQRYREDVEILALNPFDAPASIAAFQQAHSLSFPMLSCSQELAQVLGINGFPTSVCIDRDGVIRLIQSGAITDSTVFDQLFQVFTAEDYIGRNYHNIYALLN